MAAFAFGRGKIFDGEILASSASSTLPCGGEIFLRIIEDVLPSAPFFSKTQAFVIPYQHRQVGPFTNFLEAH